MESKTMENRPYVYDNLKFNVGEIFESIQSDILTRFRSVPKEKLKHFSYPSSESNTPIKQMTPYQDKTDFEYIGKDSFYKVEQERSMLVFSN